MHHLHPILQRQQIDYTIFVVEQAGQVSDGSEWGSEWASVYSIGKQVSCDSELYKSDALVKTMKSGQVNK